MTGRFVDVCVIGRSLSSLQAALDFAEVGLSVAVCGGSLELPGGPEIDERGAIAALLERIAAPIVPRPGTAGAGPLAGAEELRPRRFDPRPAWLLDRDGAWAPQPDATVLGIPAVPLAEANLRLLGTAGALRAHLDRVMPLLTIGKTRSFGKLVRSRLGATATERLVAPFVRERFGTGVDETDSAVAAPGLNEALSRAGSLTVAALTYSERNVARETRVEPGNGWEALASAMLERLSLYDVRLLDESVHARELVEDVWRIDLRGADAVDAEPLHARAVVLSESRDPHDRSASVGGGPAVTALAPARARVYAETDIQAPEPCATALESGADCVRLLGDWALRFAGDTQASGPAAAPFAVRALLSGPAVESLEDGAPSVDDAYLDALLAEAGAARLEASSWEIRRTAAPYATVGQRREAEARLEAVAAEEARLLPVGRVLHGDELGASLVAAHSGAVLLRRLLLGLSG